MDLDNFKNRSNTEFPSNKKLVQKLKNKKPKVLDQMFSEAHDKAFLNINCWIVPTAVKPPAPYFCKRILKDFLKFLV
jgi:uncharacterized protein